MKTSLTVLALAALAGGASAQETRELGAHEHGHSTLDIAFDGEQVAMALEAPGADIVGFEYPAESVEDRAAIDAAIAALSEPLSLFVLPAPAGCSVTEASASLFGGHAEEHEGEAQPEGEDHDDGTGHTEFQASYLLTCTDTGAIDRIEFAYFATFENAMEVDVQMISDGGSKGFEVERADPVLDLAGQI